MRKKNYWLGFVVHSSDYHIHGSYYYPILPVSYSHLFVHCCCYCSYFDFDSVVAGFHIPAGYCCYSTFLQSLPVVKKEEA